MLCESGVSIDNKFYQKLFLPLESMITCGFVTCGCAVASVEHEVEDNEMLALEDKSEDLYLCLTMLQNSYVSTTHVSFIFK